VQGVVTAISLLNVVTPHYQSPDKLSTFETGLKNEIDNSGRPVSKDNQKELKGGEIFIEPGSMAN
jgi:hypothetical protein